MDIKTARATELRVIQPICEFSWHDGYLVYRSVRFPRFYGANGIEFERRDSRSLADCEALFDGYFSRAEYEHKTFTFDDAPEYQGLIADAAENGYHVMKNVYLFAREPAPDVVIPESTVLRKVDSEARWHLLEKFYDLMSVGYDWYDETVTRELFEKTRVTSEAIGIEWFYLSPSDRDEIWCKLGMFSHGGVCRLQDVGTRPDLRRRGLARGLVNSSIGMARDVSQGVIVCAEEDYHALDLYRNLGFRDLGTSMQLTWYEPNDSPIRGP